MTVNSIYRLINDLYIILYVQLSGLILEFILVKVDEVDEVSNIFQR